MYMLSVKVMATEVWLEMQIISFSILYHGNTTKQYSIHGQTNFKRVFLRENISEDQNNMY